MEIQDRYLELELVCDAREEPHWLDNRFAHVDLHAGICCVRRPIRAIKQRHALEHRGVAQLDN